VVDAPSNRTRRQHRYPRRSSLPIASFVFHSTPSRMCRFEHSSVHIWRRAATTIDRFRGADFYVAHNCEFESSFFAAHGIELGPWICTHKCAVRVWPELDGHSNQELRYALGQATPYPGFDRSSISPHRAAFVSLRQRPPCGRSALAPSHTPSRTTRRKGDERAG